MKKNEKGIATIESVMLLSIFVVFMTYMVGMFGVIHSGILNSISARAYTFETLRNRANANFFRDSTEAGTTSKVTNFFKFGFRAHGITTEGGNDSSGGGNNTWYVTQREIAKGRELTAIRSDGQANVLYDKAPNNRETGSASPVYIKTVYGICLNATCGGGS